MTEYTGKVHVGGPVATHELSHLIISKVAVGPMDNNAFLLRCRDTDHQVLIDAANDTRTLLRLIGDGGLERVITTHRHGDHWQSLGDVVGETGATTVAGAHDAEGIPVRTDRAGRGRRHDHGRPVHASRSSTWSATPRFDRPAVRRPDRSPAPVHRRLALPRRCRATPTATRSDSTR